MEHNFLRFPSQRHDAPFTRLESISDKVRNVFEGDAVATPGHRVKRTEAKEFHAFSRFDLVRESRFTQQASRGAGVCGHLDEANVEDTYVDGKGFVRDVGVRS